MTVRSSSYMTGLFFVPIAGARSLVPDDYFDVAEVLPGKAVFFIGTGECRDSDIGAYKEMYVGFYTENREREKRPGRFTNFMELVRNQSKMFMWKNWVSSTAAIDKMDVAGSKIFRLGKIEREDLESSTRFSMEHEEDGSIQFSTPRESRSVKSDFQLQKTHYGRLHGEPSRCQLDLDVHEMVTSPREGELQMQGRIATECERIGIPKKPLVSIWIPEMGFKMHKPLLLRRG
jgi:hypothetical protein